MINWLDIDFEKTIREYDYTRIASRNIERIVTSEAFEDMDSDRIYEYLLREMEIVSFKDYLKRYIYERVQFTTPFREVTDQEFGQIIESNFLQNNAPHSFSQTSKKLSQAVKGWLRQESAKRGTIFLLGFGLRMSVQDVSEFLVKVIQEEDFDFNAPEEVIYWYCFKKSLRYAEAKKYIEYYQNCPGAGQAGGTTATATGDLFSSAKDAAPEGGGTMADAVPAGSGGEAGIISWKDIITRTDFEQDSERYLKEYLAALKSSDAQPRKNEDAFREFSELYGRVQQTIVHIYEQDTVVQKPAGTYKPEDIGPSDIEKILLSGIPHTESGNLTKASSGLLCKQFREKRPERHRIDNILKRKVLVDRFDLITMLFLVYAQEVEPDWPAERFILFIDEINAILERSHMLELYPANPYEAFISMCLLSDSPLSVYADIWEMSYETQDTGD